MRRVLRELVELYWKSGVSADIPALAWYLLSSLVPLALGLTALAAVALGDYAQAQALAARVSHVLPKDVQDQIVALILRTQKDSPLLIAGAIAGMVWTSSGAVGVLDRYLSRMLSIRGPSPVLGLVRNVGVAFAVAVLVVMMVLLATAGTGLVDRLHVNATLVRVAVPLLLLAVIILICASLFRVLAGERVDWRAALAGGGERRADPADHADRRRLLHRLGCQECAREGVPGPRRRADHLLHRRRRATARSRSGRAGAARAQASAAGLPAGLGALSAAPGPPRGSDREL